MSLTEETPLKKFMFTRSFDTGHAAQTAEREKKPVLMKPEQIDAIKQEAHDQGFTAGRQAGLDAQLAAHAELLTRLDQHILTLTQSLSTLHEQEDKKTRAIIPAIIRRLMPELVKQHGMNEIEALVSQVMRDMQQEKRLVIRLNESEVSLMNEKIQSMANNEAFVGTLTVLADPSVAAGDCRIEWDNGGIERNTNANLSTIDTLITGA